jgi:hypothetical protein
MTMMRTRHDFSIFEFMLKTRATETLLTTSVKFLSKFVNLSLPLCANGRGFATDSRFLRCCDYLGKRVLQVYSPRGKAISDSVGTVQAKAQAWHWIVHLKAKGAPNRNLPLVCAHWAIVRGWAEPHYLASVGLMPAGAVVVYAPRDEQELGVCDLLFSQSYRFACGFPSRGRASLED